MDVWTVDVWTAKPGDEDAFASTWREFLGWTVREFDGVLGGTRIFRGTNRPDQFFSPIHWSKIEAITAWQSDPRTQPWLRRLRELAVDETLHIMETVAEIRREA